MELDPQANREKIAYHEAGHAVVAFLLPGARNPRKLVVREDGSGYTEPEGDLPPQDQITPQEAEDEAVAILAGMEAEILTGTPWHRDEGLGRDETELRWLAASQGKVSEPDFQAWKQKAYDGTWPLVEKHKAVISVIAQLGLSQGTIDKDQLHDEIRRHLP